MIVWQEYNIEMSVINLFVSTEAAPRRREVEDKLRAAIIDGQFAPGGRLVERELCALLQVSRTSVREALRQLEAEGLVKVLPYRGPVVSTLSADEAEQIYRVREVLEGLAGQGFVDYSTADQQERLNEAYKQLSLAVRSRRIAKVLGLKEAFYRVLIEGCGNIYAGEMLQQLNNRIRLLRATSLSDPNRPSETIKEMRKIVEAIHSRDRQAVWNACVEHVRSAATIALAVLRKSDEARKADEERSASLVRPKQVTRRR